ncbi:MAG: ParA family protein [Acidobacteria bacterium]|nr:ParA family protein [Acidobacteriota bacterium]
MSCTVCFVNMKGGVGKTTLLVQLAWGIQSSDRQVLVVDLDPQSNASQYLLGHRRYRDLVEQNRGTVLNIFEQNLPAPLSGGQRKKLGAADVVLDVGRYLDLIPARLELSWTLKNPATKENLLAGFLTTRCSDYDVVLIDCPPTESIFTTAAYLASDYVAVPVKPDYLSTIGLPLLGRSLLEFHDAYGKSNLQLAGIVFCLSGKNPTEEGKARREVQTVASANNWYVFRNGLRSSGSYERAAREGQPIAWTPHTRWWVKDEFRELRSEFLRRVGLETGD